MSSMIGPGAIGIDADTAAARGSPRGPPRWPVTAAVLPALGLRATDLHRDVVRVPQREENRARYFLDRHRLPDARFSAGAIARTSAGVSTAKLTWSSPARRSSKGSPGLSATCA